MKVLISLILNILAWIAKNTAQVVGVLEALCKVIAGIISLAPIKKKDVVLAFVDKVFSAIKKLLYDLSDFLAK